MTSKEAIKYWVDSAEYDFEVMNSLFGSGHYIWALFVGHLVVEKLLKAYYVKAVNADTPYTHNLLEIAKRAGLGLSESQEYFLDEVTTFNIKARYPDYKKEFYKKADKIFTKTVVTRIREFRVWLKEKMTK